MTQEEKQLLLIDLCARLPYGVMVRHDNEHGKSIDARLVGYNGDWFNYYIDDLCFHLKIYEFKPYLRPMSSMTEEEKKEFHHVASLQRNYLGDDIFYTHWKMYDWLNSHHFDYRGLIERGLAIVVTEENNLYKD